VIEDLSPERFESVARLCENADLKWIVDRLRTKIMREWAMSNPDQPERREVLFQNLQYGNRFAQELKLVLNELRDNSRKT
jgi:hypothetical protein